MQPSMLLIACLLFVAPCAWRADNSVVFPHDPVALIEGRVVDGKADWTLVRNSYEYRFESEESRKKFEAQPEAFVQLARPLAWDR